MHTALDREACYRALQTRDARFDGVFYVGVLSTGIYCRPICPAGPPKLENCTFLPSAAAAHQRGFRPCRRCRPELSPGVAGWRGTANTVYRALNLISEGALNEGNVDALADRLGVTARHLRRLFHRHVGATPIAVAQTNRILLALKLLGETPLAMTDVAMAAGFGSIRRFNAVMHGLYGKPPSQLQSTESPVADEAAGVTIKLPFSPPYDWRAMIDFLALRAMPGVEAVESARYRRTFDIDGAQGIVEVRQGENDDHLLATIWTNNIASLGGVIARLRRLFDLDADMAAIDAYLASDSSLAARVRARPGVRVPGAWGDFEVAVRAVLGQQVTVKGATTLAGRLVAAAGRPLDRRIDTAAGSVHTIFPTPATVASLDLTRIGLIRSRADTLRALGRALVDEPDLLRPFGALEETIEKLVSVPGIGPWTAHYIAMRVLREPDAFPASDVGLLRAFETSSGRPTPRQLLERAEAWRPWRAYAAMRLWVQPSATASGRKARRTSAPGL